MSGSGQIGTVSSLTPDGDLAERVKEILNSCCGYVSDSWKRDRGDDELQFVKVDSCRVPSRIKLSKYSSNQQ